MVKRLLIHYSALTEGKGELWPCVIRSLIQLKDQGIQILLLVESEVSEDRNRIIRLLENEEAVDQICRITVGLSEHDALVELAGLFDPQGSFYVYARESLSILPLDKRDFFQENLYAGWEQICTAVLKAARDAHITRKTNETDIDLHLELDGEGRADISTGLGFFDHMLAQIAVHSGCNIRLSVKGDLEVDPHHTIEDTALVLGRGFKEALGTKSGIERYGFLLPMDESLARIALDFSGRPAFQWNVSFAGERIGDMPTEMFKHFFKSFSDAAQAALHIQAEGENDHHKAEALFKGLGRVLGQAIRKTTGAAAPASSKGSLTV
jgi:imidazoleglycerol phosphate dehydratase HisB